MKLYDPNLVKLIAAGVPVLGGYQDGSFVEVKFMSADYESQVGTDGEVVRSQLHDKRGTVTIKLMQSADANAALNTVRLLGQSAGSGADIGPLSVSDLNGKLVLAAPHSWVVKYPDSDFDKTAKTREWVFECDVLTANYASPVVGYPVVTP